MRHAPDSPAQAAPAPAPRTHSARLPALALWLAAFGLALATCRGGPRGGLYYVQDDQFAIRDPDGRQAAATGIGCDFSEKAALTRAQHTAQYNLRSMMGPGRYKVRFEKLREFREGERHCAEVEAQVVF